MEAEETNKGRDTEESEIKRDLMASPQIAPSKNLGGDTNESIRDTCIGNSVSGHDSGLSSVEGSSQCQSYAFQRLKASPYTTSTPKKGVQFLQNLKGLEVLPSQMILDDPLLSSIDEPGEELTDHDVNSYIYDDETDDEDSSSSPKLYDTKIKANSASRSSNSTLMSRFMNDSYAKDKAAKRTAVGDTNDSLTKAELSAVKRNLFDIPVSPKLKSKVRQRLYTLVNSIDGYETNLDMEETDNNLTKRKSSSSPLKSQNSASIHLKHRSGNRFRGMSNLSTSRCNAINDGKQSFHTDTDRNKSLNLSHHSSLNNDINERYTSALSSVIESQLRTLNFHQDQLNREKLNFTLQKKEEEVDTRISLYKDKLFQMIQLLEEMDSKLRNSEKERLQQAQYFKKKVKQQNEMHKENMSLLRLEYEKKLQTGESNIAEARLEVTKACDEKIQDIVKSSRERAAVIEKKHQDHVTQLAAIISNLQTERDGRCRISDSQGIEIHLKDRLAEVSKEKDLLNDEVQMLKERLVSCNDAQRTKDHRKVIADLEVKQRALQEELCVWKDEATKLHQKMSQMESHFKKQNQEIVEECHKKEKDNITRLNSQFDQKLEEYRKLIGSCKENLKSTSAENEMLKLYKSQLETQLQKKQDSESSIIFLEKEVKLLKTQLEDSKLCLTREKENNEQLQGQHAKQLVELREQYEQEMISYRLLSERERSVAVSRAMVHREDETLALLKGVESRYQELLKTLQAHFKAQIEEYKKAVKILKLKLKRLEEETGG